MEKLVICRRFKFDAAHFLPYYIGKCNAIHGHSWSVEIELDGTVNPKTGMIIDFKDFKTIVNTQIIDKLDHKLLNDLILNPTAENIIHWMLINLDIKHYTVTRIRLYESEDSYVEWRKE